MSSVAALGRFGTSQGNQLGFLLAIENFGNGRRRSWLATRHSLEAFFHQFPFPGRIRLWPYQRAIADAIADPEIELAARVEPFGLDKIPAEVMAISCGCDCQDDRLEVTLCGWNRAGESFVLAHIVLWGSPDDDTTWQELDELLKSRWRHPYGGFLKIDACAVDSGDGDWTQRVYDFSFPRASRRVMAIKGASGGRPAIQVSKSKIKGAGRLWIRGVDTLKTTIFDRVARGPFNPAER